MRNIEEMFKELGRAYEKAQNENGQLQAELTTVAANCNRLNDENIQLRAELAAANKALNEISSFRRANIYHPDSWRIAAEMMRLTANKACAKEFADAEKWSNEVERLSRALNRVIEAAQEVLDNAHWEVKVGSGDLITAMRQAKALAGKEQP